MTDRSGNADEFPLRVDRNVYPCPEYRYPGAKIGTTYADSVADFPSPLEAPEGAPNILLALLDDVGFGWSSALGGLVRMPTAERLAQSGLTYNQFHTTALCSPTRAALLTGRNHHSVHSGNIGELATGFPGYDGVIPKSCATIAELLHENGYASGWWGKNHNVPDNQTSEAGPFDNWPTQRGFDYFYGFIGGETDQFYPALCRGTRAVPVPDTPENGYHLTRDLANDCIDWMRRQKAIAPNRPFFAYFSTGATHAPHQPPLDWRGRNAGRFDLGWDQYREETWQRQLDMGVIPEDAQLTPRPEEIPAWDDHTDDQQRLMARQAENFADYLEHTDYEVGRLVDALEEMGELENTLVIYIIGDNGSSAEGSLTGIVNEMMGLNGYQPTFDQLLPRIDEIGLPGTSPHYAVGWAWAGDTPFQWTKQVASHFGGTRNGTIISWPSRIADTGKVRSQFHHAIDILPTILEVAGIAEPAVVNGVPQKPIEEISMAYSFAPEHADAPSRRYTQYFEMFGNRGIWHKGWKAVTEHGPMSAMSGFKNDNWQLFHTDEDRAEAHDLATEFPDKLEELKALWFQEAEANKVLPLNDLQIIGNPEDFETFIKMEFHMPVPPSGQYTYYPGTSEIPERSAANTHGVSYKILAEVDLTPETEGVIFAHGSRFGGHALIVKDGQITYVYNFLGIPPESRISAPVPPAGPHIIGVEFTKEGMGEFREGVGPLKLYIDDQVVAEDEIRTVLGHFSLCGEGLCIGYDSADPVSALYSSGFPFTGGEIRKVVFDIADDAYIDIEAHLAAAMARD